MAAATAILQVHPHFNPEEAAHAAAEFVTSKPSSARFVTYRRLQVSITSLAK